MKREHNKSEGTLSSYLRGKGYQTCEYIESHGNEYILPNVTLNSSDIIEVYMSMKTQIVPNKEQNYVSLYDSTLYYSYCPTIVHYGDEYDEYEEYLDIQTSYIGGGGGTPVNFNEKINFLATFNQRLGTYLEIQNQVSPKIQILHSIPNNSRLQLLAYIKVERSNKGICKVYKCDITKNSELVRDLYPVYNISSGISGLYDMVSETFFGNNGTGSFTHGADIEI